MIETGNRHIAGCRLPGDARGKGLPLPAYLARQLGHGRQLGNGLPQPSDLPGVTGSLPELLLCLRDSLEQLGIVLTEAGLLGVGRRDGVLRATGLGGGFDLSGPGPVPSDLPGGPQTGDHPFLARELSVTLAQRGSHIGCGGQRAGIRLGEAAAAAGLGAFAAACRAEPLRGPGGGRQRSLARRASGGSSHAQPSLAARGA